MRKGLRVSSDDEVEDASFGEQQRGEELVALRRTLVVEIVVNGLDELWRLEQELFAKDGLGDGEQNERGLVVKMFELAVNDLGALLPVLPARSMFLVTRPRQFTSLLVVKLKWFLVLFADFACRPES